MPRLIAIYRVESDPAEIEAKARAIATEQSVEMPLEAIDDQHVLDEIVGRVESIADTGEGAYEVRISLWPDTVGRDAGQFINMAFGNSSMHEGVTLEDVILPDELAAKFPGPNIGMGGLRRRVGAGERALTCTALKPQGLPVANLASLAGRMAEGDLDYIKDDHSIAEQDYSPFAARVEACTRAVRERSEKARYVPSLTGNLDALRRQIQVARACGVDTVMIQPMILGFSNMQALVEDNRDMAFLAHPTMTGCKVSQVLLNKLFRLFGADAVIFAGFGGRFGYSRATCRAIAQGALSPWHGKRPAIPVPAGGMVLDRVPELLDFYGRDVMLLIGGSLLLARGNLVAAAREFQAAVESH